MFPTDVKNTDHPDFVGGIVWSTLELKWINERDEQWKALLAFYADPSTAHSPVPDSVREESDWLKACKFCEEKFGDLVIEDNNPLAFSEGIDMLYFYKKDYIEPRYLTKEKVTIDGIQYRVALCNNPIKACFVPMDTDIGHIRHCNSTLPMFDTNKKYHGVFSKDDYVPSNSWFNLPKGAKLVTGDGLESVEPGTMYRVIKDTNYPDHINLLIRLPKYPYPDKDQRGKYA